ncbi:hypothetical protein [Comamonas sp. NoAH]|uniref:hypothetical protein n=1 Tax=Comamonas halotolerans TaxID=3041496 RepID=UPI0024E0E04B|nr:hypothetical protein [Comamonas sp. NoAH]
MPSLLKSVSIEEIENAIAIALQELAHAKDFSVKIGEIKFSPLGDRVDFSMFAWDNSFGDEPFGSRDTN